MNQQNRPGQAIGSVENNNPYAKQHLEQIDRIIGEIKLSQVRPGWKPQTSLQVRERANSLRSMATTIKMNGGQTRKEYE